MLDEQPLHSRLFTLRLWQEAVGDTLEWRGKVQQVDSGETQHFRNWDALTEFLVAQMDNSKRRVDPPNRLL